MIENVLYGVGCIAFVGFVFYGWEILVSNSKYRRWREQGLKDAD